MVFLRLVVIILAVQYTHSLLDYPKADLGIVTPLNSTAVNLTWSIVPASGGSDANNGTLGYAIHVCGVASYHGIGFSPITNVSTREQHAQVIATLNPNAVYHACLLSNWTAVIGVFAQSLHCQIVRTFTDDETTRLPIPDFRQVTWQQVFSASTTTVYVDVFLARELAISPSAEIQFGSLPARTENIREELNSTHLMRRFVFANLTADQEYRVKATIYLLSTSSPCAAGFRQGYVVPLTIKTASKAPSSSCPPFSTASQSLFISLLTILSVVASTDSRFF